MNTEAPMMQLMHLVIMFWYSDPCFSRRNEKHGQLLTCTTECGYWTLINDLKIHLVSSVQIQFEKNEEFNQMFYTLQKAK